MTRNRALLIGAVAAALAVAGTTAALAGSGEGPDTAITGTALASASAAALAHTGAGRVTDTEAGDEEAAYEVEVTMPDGSEVDVHLDKDFRFVPVAEDNDDATDED